ncbi:emp24p/erv25p- protein [Gaertneriomyces sp. JEL0708]|nr:emp24p/erv25p- protein [Gaertneriomyces sp. JEL0708]
MRVLAILLMVVMAASQVSALHMYLEGSEQKCFMEELPGDTTVVGTFSTEQYNSATGTYALNEDTGIQIKVDHIESRQRVLNQKGASAGKFAFSTADAGEYAICLSTNSTNWFATSKTRLYLDLLFGDATHDTQPNAKKEVLSDLALKVRELNVKVSNIRREQGYQKDREAEFRNTSEKANAQIRNWTIAQIVVLGLTCVWQVRSLKNFFIAKKLV